MTDSKPTDKRAHTVLRKAHWIEWTTGLICALLVTAMILLIAYHAVTGSDGKPDIAAIVLRQESASGGYQVFFEVENKGMRTAAAVPVIARLMEGEKVVEIHEVTFDYVPAQSSATGAFLFKANPSGYRLEIRAAGYIDP
ncbi:TIGR02588 family protein [Rhizobium sp. Root482]|jgi:uncharacterized protein (TIGR02588 family)|uniref:TIGR02588 family protein n=1 Tax=Rhizobium sp. Root482 TaxID=1736543 RepID=UPI0006FBF4A4|nr:TIGR02588 family protein [Rhizobium sp. Root482]KQY20030.1 hypothetical protein ASD31_06550 [Rhizobium sp. Root482]